MSQNFKINVISVYLITFSVGTSILFLFEDERYLTFFAALIVILKIVGNQLSNPFRGNITYLVYVADLIFLILFYSDDVSTFINLFSIFLFTYASFLIARDFVSSALLGIYGWMELRKSLEYCLIAMFFVSILLTAVGMKDAPDAYPWQQIMSGSRLLLIDGNVGQTSNVYLEGLLLQLYIYETSCSLQRSLRAKILLIIALLVLSQSRVAYFFIAPIILSASRRLQFLKIFKFSIRTILVLIPALFLYGAVNASLEKSIDLLASSAQDIFGNAIRITNANQASPDTYDASSGRDALNLGLFLSAEERPLIGLGHSAPILTFGVDQNGAIAKPGQEVSSGESSLRLAVEYGWPFYFLTLAILSSELIYLFQTGDLEIRDLSFGLIFVTLCTFVFEGEFDNYYGPNSILLFMVFCINRARYTGWHAVSSDRRLAKVDHSTLDKSPSLAQTQISAVERS